MYRGTLWTLEDLKTEGSPIMPLPPVGGVGGACRRSGSSPRCSAVIKAMGALDQSPKLLGGFIGAALVGTFAGIFLSYGIIFALALKIKMTRREALPALHHRQADTACLS